MVLAHNDDFVNLMYSISDPHRGRRLERAV